MAKATAKKPPTKTEIVSNIAEATELTKREVNAVFEALSEEIRKSISKRGGPGQFSIPGMCKIIVQRKPATKERKGTNPFTGEDNRVQSQAGPQRDQDSPAEESERHGRLKQPCFCPCGIPSHARRAPRRAWDPGVSCG